VKPWIQCVGGTFIDLLDPTVEQVRKIGVPGFASALAHLNRFTGWVGQYSVAQHSINVAECVRSELGRPDLYLPALWHDGAEAATGDISTPMKWAMAQLGGPDSTKALKEITWRLDRVIEEAFDIPKTDPNEHDIIKQADLMVLRAERERFMVALDGWREADWQTHFRGLPAARSARLDSAIRAGTWGAMFEGCDAIARKS
jgi:hypothetical protein